MLRLEADRVARELEEMHRDVREALGDALSLMRPSMNC
jgi:hypothetical protein